MTASLATSPEAALKAALDGIQRRAATRGFLTPQLRKADPNALQLCLPHRLAFVPLNELLAGEKLRSAAHILGWRVFIFESKNLIAAAHVMRTDQGELRLSELNEGQFVGGSMDALQTIFSKTENKDEGSKPPEFELLLVVAPALCFVGWWARFENEHDDWVFPVDPTTIRGLGSTLISSSDLIPALQREYIRASCYRTSS
jgi:hypothetical protein